MQVTIWTTTEPPWTAYYGASIRYTTDGTAPSQTNGTVIENGGTVTLSKNTTLKAMATMSGFMDSKVSTARFEFNR